MVNKAMRCASKAAESASTRLCADAEAETTATDVSSVAEATQPVSLGDAGARHEDTHIFTEYELGVSYFPDTEDGSVSTAIETKPPAKRGMDDALRRSIFVSSDESDEPSPKRRRSRSQDSGANSGVGSPIDTTSQRGTSPSVGTSQEERDRNVLRLASEKKAWMPPKSVMDHLSATTSDRYRTRLFDSSRIHHLDPSAKNYRAENEFFIDAFFKHRWYSGNHKRDGPSLIRAWIAYIHNLEDVGRDVWNDKLIKARDKFEKRTPTGARYKQHRLSREKGLPCLSWGDSCPCCVNNSARAPKEAYLLTSPWWRVRISTEMHEGIDNLKTLYDRAGKTFSGGPSAAQDVPRRTAQPDPVRRSLAGSGAPKNPRTGDSRATGRDNSSDVRSRRGGSTAAQLDSAGHRESPSMEVEEEIRRSPNYRGGACVSKSFFDRVTLALRGELEHEQDMRLQLADTVSKHQAEFAFAQLENERARTSLRDELRVARGDVGRSRAEITALQTLVDIHHREHKAICEMFERKGVLHRKKQRLMVRLKPTNVKRGMRSYLTWQLDRVCVA
uniref:Uncharacterized protein n=1 Tax=Peronospora matthiolae TaxID=2874970 RepID=A0AAV1UYL7_9STRA